MIYDIFYIIYHKLYIIYYILFIIYFLYIIYILYIIEGSLEVKLPTIWRDEKQSREEA